MRSRIRRLSVTDAARNFADVVNRAFYRHEVTVLLKNGVPVAHIAPGEPEGLPADEARERLREVSLLGALDASSFARDIDSARATLPRPRSPWA